jgi:hypothetical protein
MALADIIREQWANNVEVNGPSVLGQSSRKAINQYSIEINSIPDYATAPKIYPAW